MRNVLFFIPLKPGCLDQYKTFAKETIQRDAEYKEMLTRYDIHSAKTWHKNISGKDYILVYHDIGSNFEEKMKGWDTSNHPFDKWFRDGIMAVYDIENANGMEMPKQIVDFKV